MDDELKAKLLQYLEVLEEGARRGSDFAAEKVPETIQQWINFAILTNAIGAIAFVAVAGVLAMLANRFWAAYRALPDTFTNSGAVEAIMLLSSVGGMVACMIFSGIHAGQAAMAWIAPNVFIVKEIAGLLK